MNWLAHIFLSENNIDFQIGNYLADPLKGKSWQEASAKICQGMNIHTRIDSFTDNHKYFHQSKQRLANKGLLRGIVIDLTYDYLLTKNWNTFCSISQEEFLQHFYNNAYARLDSLPIHAREPLKRMIDFDLLNKYQNINDLYQAFQRVDKRLSPRLKQRDQTISYYNTVKAQINHIEKDFLYFFPQLCKEIKPYLEVNNIEHWRI